MKTEKEKMLAGELYNALDKQLSDERLQTRLLLKELNDGREDEPAKRALILKKLIPNAGEDLWLQPPFYCDYGSNMYLVLSQGCFEGYFRLQCHGYNPRLFIIQALQAWQSLKG
jgi:hypothetical protein